MLEIEAVDVIGAVDVSIIKPVVESVIVAVVVSIIKPVVESVIGGELDFSEFNIK